MTIDSTAMPRQMNQSTTAKVKKIDAIIRKIEILQGEALSMFLDSAIENMRLTRIAVIKDGEVWDQYQAEKELEVKP